MYVEPGCEVRLVAVPSDNPAVRSIAQAFPNRVCGVLRTEDSDAGFQACLAALEGGVQTIEITKTVPSCFELIRGLMNLNEFLYVD